MGTYRKEWACCGSVTETQAWEPESCPFCTPSTPSQAWDGELPEFPMPFFKYLPVGPGLVRNGYSDDQMRDYARKAIGAAVAGVRDKALEEAAAECERMTMYEGARQESAAHDNVWEAAKAIRSLSSNPVSLREKARADDFAKIVRATSGQQVLFFKEVCEEGNTLHCVANFEDFQSDLAMAGLPDDAFATALDKVDVKMADQVLAQVADLGFGDTASNGNGEKGGSDE